MTGFTLVQLLVALVVLALLTAVATPRFLAYQDASQVRAASADVAAALAHARQVAFERATHAAARFDTASASLAVVSYGDTIEQRPLGALYGVSLAVTRDSITYAANAMGFGAANTRIIVARGRAADTLTVSRLGRVRH
ncbi:MAG: hypothetical protein U0163_15260 [Gemmatimonadaceae bacterium]